MLSRPLTGEPLALDLVNTQWIDHGRRLDWFGDPGQLQAWLRDQQLAGEAVAVAAPLEHARAALRTALEHPGKQADRELNAILEHGAVRYSLRRGTVHEDADVDPGWSPAWHAVRNYLDLLRRDPTRVRRCAHPACVLYFFDTSRNGTRRWCSMDGCGSRAKAARHYHRHRTTPA